MPASVAMPPPTACGPKGCKPASLTCSSSLCPLLAKGHAAGPWRGRAGASPLGWSLCRSIGPVGLSIAGGLSCAPSGPRMPSTSCGRLDTDGEVMWQGDVATEVRQLFAEAQRYGYEAQLWHWYARERQSHLGAYVAGSGANPGPSDGVSCSRGHAWTESSTHRDKEGSRRCRLCRNMKANASRIGRTPTRRAKT